MLNKVFFKNFFLKKKHFQRFLNVFLSLNSCGSYTRSLQLSFFVSTGSLLKNKIIFLKKKNWQIRVLLLMSTILNILILFL